MHLTPSKTTHLHSSYCLQCCLKVCEPSRHGHCFCKKNIKITLFQVSPQHFNWIKAQTLTGPIQSTSPLSLKPFLCSFAGMLWVIVLLHNSIFIPASTPWLMAGDSGQEFVDMPENSWFLVEKQPQIFTFPPPCFTVGRKFFFSYAVLAFLQTWWFWL